MLAVRSCARCGLLFRPQRAGDAICPRLHDGDPREITQDATMRSLNELAREMGTTHVTIRNIEQAALAKCRDYLRRAAYTRSMLLPGVERDSPDDLEP